MLFIKGGRCEGLRPSRSPFWFLAFVVLVLGGCAEITAGRVFRADATVINADALQRARLVVIGPDTPLSTRGALGTVLGELGYEVSYAVPDVRTTPVEDHVLFISCHEMGISRRGGGNTATVQCTLTGLADRKPVFLGEGEFMHRCWGCTIAGMMVREDWEGATRAALAKLPKAGVRAVERSVERPAIDNPVVDNSGVETLDSTRIRGTVRPHAVALVIGVEDYRRAPRADYASNDARQFRDFARSVLGIPHVKLLVGAEVDRTSLLHALRLWAKGEISPGVSDVIVFFAGHGLATTDGGELYLLPSDGAPDMLAETALRRSEVLSALTAAGAKSITMFLDACYSGQTRGGETLLAGLRPIFIKAKVEEPVPQGVTVFSAAAANQLSGAFPQQKHGLFSYFLMRGLSGEADHDKDHRITAGELHAYVAKNVGRQAARQGREQEPQLQGSPDMVLVQW